jgi:ankyrin repeat protein
MTSLMVLAMVILFILYWKNNEDEEKRNAKFVNIAAKGNLALIKNLLDKGANVNGRDEFDYTALMYAASCGHEKTVELLLNYGANINSKNNDNTALIMALKNGNKEIAELLIDKGANVNSKKTFT